MISHLTHNSINKAKWDTCVANCHNQLVYAFSWYLDIVSPNWEALVLNDYEAVMPLTWRNKFGINYLFNPLMVQQLGVFSIANLNDDVCTNFIDAIPSKYKYIDINFNSKNNISKHHGLQTVNKNFELLLNCNYEHLHSKFKGNTKRNIAKAQKLPFAINTDVSTEKIIDLFMNDRGKELKNINKQSYNKLPNLVAEVNKHFIVENWGVLNEANQLITGAVFFISSNKITFIFSGNSTEGKEKKSMYLLMDSFIKKYSNSNYTLDFEGGNNAGLAYFYGGFGSRSISYTTLKINKLPKLLKWLKQ